MTIDRETSRPRLRTGHVLFGVLIASAAASAATHYALCDRAGSPACGNIGQAGSPLPVPAPAPINISVVAHTAPLVEITVSQQIVAPRPRDLVAPAPTTTTPGPILDVARPITDPFGDPAPGNVMTKGGRR